VGVKVIKGFMVAVGIAVGVAVDVKVGVYSRMVCTGSGKIGFLLGESQEETPTNILEITNSLKSMFLKLLLFLLCLKRYSAYILQ
jgi:hypothetical protein